MIVRFRTAAAIAAASAIAAPAFAAEPQGPAEAPPAQAVGSEAGAKRTPLEEGQLESFSAGAIVVSSEQLLTAVSSGNSVVGDLNTGDVSFSGSALEGFTGIGNFVINTGANSNLQGAISVNIIGGSPP